MFRQLREILVVLMIVCVDSTAVAVFAQSAAPADELIRFQYAAEDVIYATVNIFDENRTFVIDTGSSMTIVDRQFESQLGKPEGMRKFRTTIGGATLPYYVAPAMTIGTDSQEMDLIVPVVGVADFSSVQAMLDRPIAGLVGMDFLRQYVLRFDLAANYAALASGPSKMLGNAESIHFSHAGTPSIRLFITNDQSHEFLLDTGSGRGVTLSLEHQLFEQLAKSERIVMEGVSVNAAIGGFKNNRSGVLEQFELGNSWLRNVDVSSGLQNLAGLKFLDRYEAELDFPNRKAYFRPGKRFHDPIPTNLTNFAVRIADHQLVVIGRRGIAEKAGINAGDLLVRVNGRPAREMTISEFRRLQCLPDTKLDLTFERETKSFDMTLNLKRPPSPFPDQSVDSPDDPPAK